MKYLKYLKYILRHKYYVMIECFKKGRYWRGIMHDMSKFRPSEFVPYARYFYGDGQDINKGRKNGSYRAGESIDEKFNYAWLLHQKRNKHHWQYWVLPLDEGGMKIFEMERTYVDEMICDWNGAGIAINGKENTREWYLKNKQYIKLNKFTRHIVETCLNVLDI